MDSRKRPIFEAILFKIWDVVVASLGRSKSYFEVRPKQNVLQYPPGVPLHTNEMWKTFHRQHTVFSSTDLLEHHYCSQIMYIWLPQFGCSNFYPGKISPQRHGVTATLILVHNPISASGILEFQVWISCDRSMFDTFYKYVQRPFIGVDQSTHRQPVHSSLCLQTTAMHLEVPMCRIFFQRHRPCGHQAVTTAPTATQQFYLIRSLACSVHFFSVRVAVPALAWSDTNNHERKQEKIPDGSSNEAPCFLNIFFRIGVHDDRSAVTDGVFSLASLYLFQEGGGVLWMYSSTTAVRAIESLKRHRRFMHDFGAGSAW